MDAAAEDAIDTAVLHQKRRQVVFEVLNSFVHAHSQKLIFTPPFGFFELVEALAYQPLEYATEIYVGANSNAMRRKSDSLVKLLLVLGVQFFGVRLALVQG